MNKELEGKIITAIHEYFKEKVDKTENKYEILEYNHDICEIIRKAIEEDRIKRLVNTLIDSRGINTFQEAVLSRYIEHYGPIPDEYDYAIKEAMKEVSNE